jgi:hypothetical protein
MRKTLLLLLGLFFIVLRASAVGGSLTESFYEQIPLPFVPTDDIDMSSSTLAPTMYLPSVNNSYPSKGYKVTLLKSGKISLSASSNEITASSFAFLVSTSYDASSSSQKYIGVGNGTTATLTPGTYYIILLTDNKYGKFKLNITFAAPPNITSISPTSGTTAGGTTVTITGTDFINATAVKFGSTNATSFTVNSDTQITATSPTGTSGTVHITVTTAGGTSAMSSADQFTYVAAPTISGILPTSGSTAGGTTVSITGTNLTAATAVKFGSANATSFTVNSATQITAISPAGSAGTVDITVTTVGGTSTTSSADQFTYVAAPTISGISPTSGSTAGGTTVTITGTNLTDATAVKFGSANATSFTVNSATQITAVSPTGSAGAVDITVTTTGGTSTTSSADQFTYVAAPTISGILPTSGSTAGGTTVAITGTNLTAATAVKFGSANATSFTVNSATQITAVAPAGSAGAVDITVTTVGRTSTTSSADQFTYVAAPTVTTNAANSITSTGATLNGSINANNASTTVTFEYGLTTSYGTSVTADQSPVTGTSATAVSYALSGLTPNTTYHYRVVGVNGGGTTNGDDLSFTTQYAPQTISFGVLDQKTYGDAPYNLAATSSSGLPVSYSSDNTAVARVLGTTVIIVGAGSANITASQAGDPTYAAATNVTKQLTVNKKALTVTAATDTKTYDGTTASTAVPTVGTLASGDAINVAPTQVFDNINAGTNALTASGLTIKRGSIDYAPAFDNASLETTHVLHIKTADIDVTGNYDISYVPATGTINKKALSVTATADTKTYDGTTASGATPVADATALVAGDAIDVAPTQAFDNASVGTTHVLTASGLTIKNGTTDATGNYDISYVSATGSITAKPLTIIAPTVTLRKLYDGNTKAQITSLGSLTGAIASDIPNLSLSAEANYNDASVGSNKTITVIYTLSGNAAANYLAPAPSVIQGASIQDKITLATLSTPSASCQGDDVLLTYQVLSGNPDTYTLTFGSQALAAGFSNKENISVTSSNASGSIVVKVPSGIAGGTYTANLKMKGILGNESPSYPFTFTINLSTDYLKTKFNNLIIFDNTSNRFNAYQWYKNGLPIQGATKQFYYDSEGLSGTYSVAVTTTTGEKLKTCDKIIVRTTPTKPKISIYPNPVKRNQSTIVSFSGIEKEKIESSRLVVYKISGEKVYTNEHISTTTQLRINLPAGIYIGNVVTSDKEVYSFKVVIE